jgi:hypothetical protein
LVKCWFAVIQGWFREVKLRVRVSTGIGADFEHTSGIPLIESALSRVRTAIHGGLGSAAEHGHPRFARQPISVMIAAR